MRRPNIVLFMADQMSALALRAYGNQTALTPHIDALAERGVCFRNAYTNFPICAPSRYSMLTGRLPHAIDAFDNAAELPAATPTLMHYLRRLGYRTTLSGKMHFVGPDQLHGFHERLITDIYPADFAWVPDWRAGPRNAPSGVNLRAVVEAGTCIRSMQLDFDEETAWLANQKLYDLARETRDNPFFLTVSLTHPHTPFTAPQAHWDRYRHDRIDMPTTPVLPLEQLDTHSRWLYYSHGRDRVTVTEEHTRNARHAYYAMCSYVDDKLGEFLNVLGQTGLDENTVFVFTSDHGEMLGERGMWYKQTFYEPSTRIPLIITGPDIPKGRIVDHNVSLVDLAPTLLSMADQGRVSTVTPLDGADLTPLWGGAAQDGPDTVIAEYSDMGVCAPCRMVRQGNYKYIYTHGHAPMLFELASDPHERHNLAEDPAHSQIAERLRRRILEDWDPIALHERILASQAQRALIWSVVRNDPRDNWSYEGRRGDKQRFVRGGGDHEGTNAVKGRARYPFVTPTPLADPQPLPDADRATY